jgi:hypothetical protein
MDAQRCQNHGPVRLLVPLLEFNQNDNSLVGSAERFHLGVPGQDWAR